MNTFLIIILSLTAFFFVIILHYLIEKYYKVIDSYKLTHRTKTKKKNTNKTTTSQQKKCCDKVFIKIYELKSKLTYKKINITTIKVVKKQLEIYGSLLASYFCTIFLYRLFKNFYYYFSPSNTGEKTDKLSRDYLDYTIYFGTILTILVIIAIIVTLIKYTVNYTSYSFSIIWIITSIYIAIVFKIYWTGEKSTLQAIFIILLYITVLPFNYICVRSIKKIYVRLLNDKGNLDPAKLTLLWTIIVFILGVVFNIKP